jgi:hypothetical protein
MRGIKDVVDSANPRIRFAAIRVTGWVLLESDVHIAALGAVVRFRWHLPDVREPAVEK